MRWYPKLYAGEKACKKTGKIIFRVNHGAGMLDIYLITLASNKQNLLDIFASSMLLQPALNKNCPMIIGIAEGYEEAIAVMIQIIEEVYQATGSFEIEAYLKSRVKKRKERE